MEEKRIRIHTSLEVHVFENNKNILGNLKSNNKLLFYHNLYYKSLSLT